MLDRTFLNTYNNLQTMTWKVKLLNKVLLNPTKSLRTSNLFELENGLNPNFKPVTSEFDLTLNRGCRQIILSSWSVAITTESPVDATCCKGGLSPGSKMYIVLHPYNITMGWRGFKMQRNIFLKNTIMFVVIQKQNHVVVLFKQ